MMKNIKTGQGQMSLKAAHGSMRRHGSSGLGFIHEVSRLRWPLCRVEARLQSEANKERQVTPSDGQLAATTP